jgi:MEDS: MEthanogen/methylotroph, DcmR Sensory domain
MPPVVDFSPSPKVRVPRHSIVFYASEAFPSRSIAENFAQGLWSGESAFIVATKEHLNAVLLYLKEFNFDICALQDRGELICVEAHTALRELRRGGRIGRASVENFFVRRLDQLITASAMKRARLMGEVVSLLVEEEQPDDALELEQCWNRMSSAYPIQVTCAYRESAFAKKTVLERFGALCDEHDAVIPNLSPSESLKTPEWFTLLQLQTSSLRREAFMREHLVRQIRNNESERLQLLEDCLRDYKPDIATNEFQEILNIVYELCWDAYNERLLVSSETPEWFKLTGELRGYSKLVIRLNIWNKHGGTS